MSNLCAGCRRDLPWLFDACPRCASPRSDSGLCGQCVRRPPPFDSAVSALRYTTTAALLLHRFKFGRNLAAGEALAWCLIHRLRRALPVDCLLPVPISDRRLRARGFDQVAELARSLSRSLGTPVCWRSRRPIHRRPQSTLADDLARRRNVAGVFHVEPDAVAGRRVAIVDDVLTSGATASELARSARAAGAREVTVWVCARAMRASS